MASILKLRKLEPGKSYAETSIVLYQKEQTRLSEMIAALNSTGITFVQISTAYVYENAWVISFPHHGDNGKDPVEALRRILGAFQEESLVAVEA